MKVFLTKPPQKGWHDKVKEVKQAVISSLRGVPLLHLAEFLQNSHNDREAGEKNVQTSKRVL
jgi:hypothetical protein